MEHNHSDQGSEIPSQTQNTGFLSRIKQVGGAALEGENGRRILTIGGVIILIVVVVVGIRVFYPGAEGTAELMPLFSGETLSENTSEESVNLDEALEMPSFVENQASLNRRIERKTELPIQPILRDNIKNLSSRFCETES